MARVVRLATTAVASRAGLNLDQADDINTALDELFRFYISQEDKRTPTSFSLCYNIHTDKLEVITEGIDDSFCDENSKVSRYCRFILEKMMDDVVEEPDKSGGLNVHITKCISAGP
jgi:anti-sigma regulatory factor (Ser/Thr protein kinase)